MPSTPYAKVKMVIDGGSAVDGGQTTSGNNVVQLQGENTAFWTSQLWEIYEYPDGFACPSGWTNINGIYQNYEVVPDPFTIPLTSAQWGKFLFRLTVNGGLLDGEYHGPDDTQPLVDESSAIKTLSPTLALTDVAFGEKKQFDSFRMWVGELKASLRTLDTFAGGGGGGEVNDGTNTGTGAGVFKDKSGVTLRFKRLKAGNANVSVVENTDDISISATGEANDGTNVGTGANVFKDKNGITLRFRRLLQGSNVTITENASDITIAASGGGSTSPGGSDTQLQYNNAGAFGGMANVAHAGGDLCTGTNLGTVATAGSHRIYGGGYNWLARNAFTTSNIGVVEVANDGSSISWVAIGSYGDYASGKQFDQVRSIAKTKILWRLGATEAFTAEYIGTSPNDCFAVGVKSAVNFYLNGSLAGSLTDVATDFGSGKGVVLWGSANTVPTTNPRAGSILMYVETDVLKYRKPDGTIVVIGATSSSAGSTGDVQINDGAGGFAAGYDNHASNLVLASKPRVGNSTAFASEGRATQAMADANQTLGASIYSRKIIETTGALTAWRTATMPHPASEDESYDKIWINACTGEDLIVSTGTGTSIHLVASSEALLRFTPDGVSRVEGMPGVYGDFVTNDGQGGRRVATMRETGSGVSCGLPRLDQTFNTPYGDDASLDVNMLSGDVTISGSNSGYAFYRAYNLLVPRTLYLPAPAGDNRFDYAKDIFNDSGYPLTVAVDGGSVSDGFVVASGATVRVWVIGATVAGPRLPLQVKSYFFRYTVYPQIGDYNGQDASAGLVVFSFPMTDETSCSFDFVLTCSRQTSVTKAGKWKGDAFYRRTGGADPTADVAGTVSTEQGNTGDTVVWQVNSGTKAVEIKVTAADTDLRNYFIEVRTQETPAT